MDIYYFIKKKFLIINKITKFKILRNYAKEINYFYSIH